MRFVYKQKDFLSGQKIIFKLYDINGNLIEEKEGIEIGNLGVYSAKFKLSPFREYLIVVYDNGKKTDVKYIPRFLRWGLRKYDDVKAPEGEKRRFLHFGFNLEDWND